MISSNIEALKRSDNLKWDFQSAYQKAIYVFNFSGESTEEWKQATLDLIEKINSIRSEVDFMEREAKKLTT